MLRRLLFCVAMLVVAGPAAADDTTRCAREAGDVAIAACTRAINSGEGRPSINYNFRGVAYYRKGDTDRAIADFTEAIRLDPKNATTHNKRGVAYHRKGDMDRAIADFTEAIRLDPKLAYAYNGRGDAYREKGDTDRAIADFNEAMRIDPKNVSAYKACHVHHRKELSRAPALRSEPLNLLSLCRSCHTREHNEARRPPACNVDGTPTDPRHPWFQK
jgi:tetratricopeptide (TPR) repeat protein